MKLEQFIRAQTPFARREILSLLTDNQILVNGEVVENLTLEIDPQKDKVRVKGENLSGRVRFETFLFYKPKGIITTLKDPKGRRCIGDYVKKLTTYVFPVGRLDRATTGLLILTNNGEFAQDVSHPSNGWVKTYKVTLDKRLTQADGERLCDGILLEDGPARFDEMESLSPTSVRVKLHEGRNRIIRRMFELLGYEVTKLHRESIGGLSLQNMKTGDIKPVTHDQLKKLWKPKK